MSFCANFHCVLVSVIRHEIDNQLCRQMLTKLYVKWSRCHWNQLIWHQTLTRRFQPTLSCPIPAYCQVTSLTRLSCRILVSSVVSSMSTLPRTSTSAPVIGWILAASRQQLTVICGHSWLREWTTTANSIRQTSPIWWCFTEFERLTADLSTPVQTVGWWICKEVQPNIFLVGHIPSLFPFLPFPPLPFPSTFLFFPYLPITPPFPEPYPLNFARGPGELWKLLELDGQSPAAKQSLVHFEVKKCTSASSCIE